MAQLMAGSQVTPIGTGGVAYQARRRGDTQLATAADAIPKLSIQTPNRDIEASG